jgi:hypothetical protein
MQSAAACVIAQQYSSAYFVSLRFHTRKKKIQRTSKERYYSVFHLVEIA